MSAAAIIWICLTASAFGATAMHHGKLRTEPVSLGWFMIRIAVETGLLYWGGFFAKVFQ